MRKKILFVVTIMSFAFLAMAQKNTEFSKDNFPNDSKGLKEAKKAINNGDGFYQRGPQSYKLALDFYLKANEFNPNNAELNFKIGTCYLFSYTKSKAVPFLEKARELDANVDPRLNFMLARGYHLTLQWDKAIAEYNAFLKTLNPTELREINDEIQKRITECKSGKELVKKPVNVKIENVGPTINTSYPEYGEVISADESVMIFTSKRPTTLGGGKDPFLNEYFEDIYISNKKDGKWTEAQNIGKPVNDEKHNATAGLSLDGQTLYAYIDENNGDLYETHLKGDKWEEPKKIGGGVNTKFHESSASLSYDGKTLYFVSDRPGGIGDRDIYYCLKDPKDPKGGWGPAVNIGSTVNSPYGEEGIFAHPDGKTIYFSSQGFNSMGGYDIFKSTLGKNGKWSKPVNLGYPINTPDDDVFFVISASGKHGYYTSIRPDGFGDKDIYMITYLEEPKDTTKKMDSVKVAVVAQTTLLKGVITDAKTGNPLEATIEVVDNQKNEVIASFKSNSATGKYLISLPSGKNYGIAVKADGYLFHSENFDIPASSVYQEIEKNVALNKIEVGQKIILNNIFFDTAKSDLRTESTNELENLLKLMNDIATLKIEISGHTDNVGSAEYNQGLSEARAKAVVDYLTKKGVSKSRMVFKGYGFTQPIADNSTEEGRQLNRRTEFKILSK